ncbi:MAG: hypothetical protein O2894_00695 [Planctomycetota bacterium]|nr:hypothetical protein [Planctomycetota bacterium]
MALLLLVLAPPVETDAGSGDEHRAGEWTLGQAQEPPLPAHCELCRLARSLDLRMSPLVEPRISRCPTYLPPIVAAGPCGPVLASRLAHLRLDLGMSLYDVPGFEAADELPVEFRVGDRVLGRVTVPLIWSDTTVEIPLEVRAALAGIRAQVTWGVPGIATPESQASLYLEAPSASLHRQLELHARRLQGRPMWQRRLLEAQLLLDEGFAHDARELAATVLASEPAEPHALALLDAAEAALGLRQARDPDNLYALQEACSAAAKVPRAERCDLQRPITAAERAARRRLGSCGG